jgi:hypothetical protein
MLEARKDALVGKLQERYGVGRDEAERQADDWIASMGPPSQTKPREEAGVQVPEEARHQPPKEAVKHGGR